VGRVSSSLAMEIHARIARIRGRRAIAWLLALGPKAFKRHPRFDQCAIQRKVPSLVSFSARACATTDHYSTENLPRHVVRQPA
jgi:hypothetical protein